MIFRAALRNAICLTSPLRFVPTRKPNLPDVARFLVERYGTGNEPRKSAMQLEALLHRLRSARFDWEAISPADRLDVAWVLWSGPQPIAEQHPPFLLAFLNWVATPWRRVQAHRLAISWAASFDSGLRSSRFVGEWLAARATLLADPWARLAADFEIFSAERGPVRLAEAFLASEESEQDFFDRIALTGRAATGGLVLEALAAAAERVEGRLAQEPGLATRLSFMSVHRQVFRPAATERSNFVRARRVRLRIAEALLLPWQRAEPPAEVRAQILDYLLRHYGDARVEDALWDDMRPPARNIMHRWLTADATETFFHLMDDQEGRRFWASYGGHIDHAWLVAGPQIADILNEKRFGYGRLTGCRPDHCVLLLHLRGITIAKTSDEKSWRAWLPHNNLAPALYCGRAQSCFSATLMNGADFSSSYGRKGNGRWQDRLDDFIKERTGIAIVRPRA